MNNSGELKAEAKTYMDISVIKKISEQEIQDNYMQVKLDIRLIIDKEMENLRVLKKRNAGD